VEILITKHLLGVIVKLLYKLGLRGSLKEERGLTFSTCRFKSKSKTINFDGNNLGAVDVRSQDDRINSEQQGTVFRD